MEELSADAARSYLRVAGGRQAWYFLNMTFGAVGTQMSLHQATYEYELG